MWKKMQIDDGKRKRKKKQISDHHKFKARKGTAYRIQRWGGDGHLCRTRNVIR